MSEDKYTGRILGLSGNHLWLQLNKLVTLPIGAKVDVTVHKEKRSKNANRYYWELIGQLSEKTHISPARIHNQYLRSMWLTILKMKGDEPIMLLLPDTDKCEKEVLEDRDDHYIPIPADYLPKGMSETVTKESGKRFRWYAELRGSSTFDTKEMSGLIDMLVQDCNEQGIETMTPDELLRLEGYEKQGYKLHR